MIDLIPPNPSYSLKGAKISIEPLIIPQEKLDELKTVLANPKLADVHKHTVMRQISGTCHSCGEKIPLHIVKYRMRGITVIEKYCDDCLRRFNT
ncbi:MAG: hypothetical protein QN778_08775 [Nitrososphaeraceae archaeon]|nr:hypothetical protein [Nitrososphaeraceae archaeon]